MYENLFCSIRPFCGKWGYRCLIWRINKINKKKGLRQYLYRGRENVLAQSVIAAIAHNINKLHFKIQSGRTGQFLTELKTA